MKRRLITLLLLVFVCAEPLYAQLPKGPVFTVDSLIERVTKYHPLSREAALIVEKAKADVLLARGAFDPQIRNETGQKSFGGEMYYYFNRPRLSIPTLGGVELQAGTEYLSGSRTDFEETKGQVSFWGVSVPLAKDLLMDRRRAMLQTAKIMRDASELEKRARLNDILLEALGNYYQWQASYQNCRLLEEAVKLNNARLQMVKTMVLLGDRPAIDTVEALAQLQNFELQYNNALLDFRNNKLQVSVFLWTEDLEPMELGEDRIPSAADAKQETVFQPLQELLTMARDRNPELLQYPFKLKALEVEKRWKFQELLPDARLSYNHLGKGSNIFGNAVGPMNFQYGLSVGIPLRLSKGRAEFRKAKLKIVETKLQQANKQAMVEMKVRSIYNEWKTLGEQLQLQQKAVNNYLSLQRAEELRYRSGESSLFFINARENKTLEAQQKYQELLAKFYFTRYKLFWAMGTLN